MILVRLDGGLANQLYGFINAYLIAAKNKQELVLDINHGWECAQGIYLLDNLNIPDFKKYQYVIKKGNITSDIYIPDRVLSDFKVLCWKYEKETAKDKNFLVFHSNKELEKRIGRTGNYLIRGFYRDKKIWKNQINKERIRRICKPFQRCEFYDEFCNSVGHERSVGIHIRRGSFKFVKGEKLEGSNYYKAAIAWFKQKYKDCRFYIFSDDIDWAREELGYDSSYFYVSLLGGLEADIIEFLCLSACNYKILSFGSTYSQLASEINFNEGGKLFYSSDTKIMKSMIKRVLRMNKNMCSQISGSGFTYFFDKRKIERYGKQYHTDNRVNGMDGKEIDILKTEVTDNFERAKAWLKKCERLCLNVAGLSNESKLEIMIKKLEALIQVKEWGMADTLAYRIRFLAMDNRKFTELYMKELAENKYYWRTAVELARFCYQYHEAYELSEGICQNEIRYAAKIFTKSKRYHFVVIPALALNAHNTVYDSVLFGEILKRLGNQISFLFKAHEFYDKYLNCFANYTDSYEVDYQCRQYSYEKEMENPDSFQANILKENYENIIVIRDLKTMEKLRPIKNVRFVFWISENGKEAAKEEIRIKELLDVADYIICEKPAEKDNPRIISIDYDSACCVNCLEQRFAFDKLHEENQFIYRIVYKLLAKLNGFPDNKVSDPVA